MKSYMKVAFLSLAVLAGIGGSFANPDLPEFGNRVVTAWGEELTDSKVGLTTSQLLDLPIVEENEEPEASALSILGGYAAAGAGWVGQKLYNLGYAGAESLGRQAIAYGASYYQIELLKEATAWGMYGSFYVLGAVTIAGPGAGAAAGLGAYHATKAAFTMLGYLPGIDGAVAYGLCKTLNVQYVTDKMIDNAPAALSTGASLAQAGVSRLAQAGSSLASYFW